MGKYVKRLLKIHKRGLSDTPMKKYYFNGCCIPGGRRLYITVDGEYHICERIGEAPNIGNVMNGIDIPRIQEKYIDEYINSHGNIVKIVGRLIYVAYAMLLVMMKMG